jgi:hypothetical protein
VGTEATCSRARESSYPQRIEAALVGEGATVNNFSGDALLWLLWAGFVGGRDDKRAMRSEEKRMGRVVSLYALKGRLGLRLVLMHILLKAVEARRTARDIH